jgi:hypothetical protein
VVSVVKQEKEFPMIDFEAVKFWRERCRKRAKIATNMKRIIWSETALLLISWFFVFLAGLGAGIIVKGVWL